MSRDPIHALQELADRQGPRHRRPSSPTIDTKAQAAVDASIEFARKSADPNPEDGVLNTYANRRGRGDAVLQPQGTSYRRPRDDVGESHGRKNRTTTRSSKRVAQEMRANADMVFFYEYQTPTATLPTGEVLDLAKEFGDAPDVGPRLADRRAVDRRRRDRRRRRRLEGGRAHSRRWRRSTRSSTSRTRPARFAR